MKKVLYIDDERSIGNSIIVTLNYGWQFGTDPFCAIHVEGFDTFKEAKEAIRHAKKCSCKSCKKNLGVHRNANIFQRKGVSHAPAKKAFH